MIGVPTKAGERARDGGAEARPQPLDDLRRYFGSAASRCSSGGVPAALAQLPRNPMGKVARENWPSRPRRVTANLVLRWRGNRLR